MNKLKINKENMIEYRNKMIVDYKNINLQVVISIPCLVSEIFFNVKEHTFSQVEVKKIIDECGLEFLGYYFRDPEVKIHRKRYPQDTKCLNLENWDDFENYNNLVFAETPSLVKNRKMKTLPENDAIITISNFIKQKNLI